MHVATPIMCLYMRAHAVNECLYQSHTRTPLTSRARLTANALQATGDASYLSDANDYYILHLYSESSGPATLAADWSEYFWSSSVLLATLTDGSTFHERSQYFMRQWICGYGQVCGLHASQICIIIRLCIMLSHSSLCP